MEKQHRLENLKACKRFLCVIGMGRDEYAYLGGKRVPRLLIRVTLAAIIHIAVFIDIINVCNGWHLGIEEWLFSAHCGVICAVKTVVYFVLIGNIDRLYELFGYIEDVIDGRMFVSFRHFCSNPSEKANVVGIFSFFLNRKQGAIDPGYRTRSTRNSIKRQIKLLPQLS